jgi:RND superfamily putative drug exporter
MTLVPAVMTLLGDAAWKLPAGLARILPNVDVEGEGLREHISSAAWASTHTGDLITAEHLVIGGVENSIDLSLPAGTTLVLAGDTTSRRLVGATLAGRLAPESGELQVLGLTVPSESGALSRRVTLVDLGSLRPDLETPVGAALAERLRFSRPLFRRGASRAEVTTLVDDVNRALSGVPGEPPIDSETALGSLSPVASALVLAALGLADGGSMLVLDTGDAGAPFESTERFADALSALVPAETTLALGVPGEADRASGAAPSSTAPTASTASTAPTSGGRSLLTLELSEPSRHEGSLR